MYTWTESKTKYSLHKFITKVSVVSIKTINKMEPQDLQTPIVPV